MKSLNAYAWSLSAILAATATAQEMLWIDQFGTNRTDIARAVTPDGTGGVFVAGETNGDLGGPNAGGGSDVFICRYDADGEQTWITQFGNLWEDVVSALAPDGAGGMVVAGYTAGDLGGPNAGDWDGFLARLDASGEQIWLTQFGTKSADWPWALTSDGVAGVFVAGMTGGSLGGPNAGDFDAFLAHYDVGGGRTWLTQFGTDADDGARGLVSDGTGGVFVAGETEGSLGGPNAGMHDAFLAHTDADGKATWVTQFGTEMDDFVRGLAADGAGGVFVAGSTRGDLAGPNAGLQDAFLARYDAGGGQTWITQFGTDMKDFVWALAADGVGGVFVAGYTRGDLAGPNAGLEDAFLARYDANGGQMWITQFGTDQEDEARALAPDGGGGVCVAGSTIGNLGGPNLGSIDAFLARFRGAEPYCYPDLNDDSVLDLFDFLAFVNLFNATDPAADCDGDGEWTLFDFLCYTNAFNAGC